MAGDLIINDPAVATAPKNTVAPGSSRFVLKQVRASFDGTSAAGAWLPALEIVSDAGLVTARYVGTSVAAGASADASFFPRAVGSAAASATSPTMEILGDTSGATTLPANGTFALLPWVHIAGTSLLDLTSPTLPKFKAAGTYAVTAYCRWATAAAFAGNALVGQLRLGTGSNSQFFGTSATLGTDTGSGFIVPGVTITAIGNVVANDGLLFSAAQSTGVIRNAGLFGAYVVKLA